MLDNPTYAGAYAYGRRHSKTVIKDGHAKRLKQQRRPLGEWEVLNLDHHPGYIGWNEYLRNQRTLEANSVVRGAAGSNAPKAGQALLGGLLRCGRCGRMLLVAYGSAKHGCVARYYCRSDDMAHASKRCVSVGALRVDEAVSAKVIEALQPLGVQASIEAAEQLARRDDGRRRIFELSLEKARYEADRARRQYDAVEPENRLVAAELEARWNDALRQVRELESRLQSPELADPPLTDEERQRLADLGRDVRSLWDHPDASASLKKRILRTILEEIVIDIAPEPPQTQLRLHWAGGVHTELRVRKNRSGQHRHCTDREVVGLVRELAKVCKDYEIASTLNRLGYRTGAANTWTETRVRSLRQYNTIPACDPDSRATWVTLKAAAEALEVDPSVIRRLIRVGTLPARQIVPHSPWIIERKDLALPAVRHAAKAGGAGPRVPRGSPGQLELPLE